MANQRKNSGSREERPKTVTLPRKNAGKTAAKRTPAAKRRTRQMPVKQYEAIMLALMGLAVLLAIAVYFKSSGRLLSAFAYFLFGLTGVTAYLLPVVIFVAALFKAFNQGNQRLDDKIKLVSSALLILSAFVHILSVRQPQINLTIGGEYLFFPALANYFRVSGRYRMSGGFIGGLFGDCLLLLMGRWGGIIFLLVLFGLILLVLTEVSLVQVLTLIKRLAQAIYARIKRGMAERRQAAQARAEGGQDWEQSIIEAELAERRAAGQEEAAGSLDVPVDKGKKKKRSFIDVRLFGREEALKDEPDEISSAAGQEAKADEADSALPENQDLEAGSGQNRSESERPEYAEEIAAQLAAETIQAPNKQEIQKTEEPSDLSQAQEMQAAVGAAEQNRSAESSRPAGQAQEAEGTSGSRAQIENSQKPVKTSAENSSKAGEIAGSEQAEGNAQQAIQAELELSQPTRSYFFPPLELLKEPKPAATGESGLIENNVRKLEETLHSFSVSAKVINVSQGPTVTRYEIQPAQGVKVSRIVNLADDIALNLAAAGIRMEAPIPGKSAIGIEVPNREAGSVMLREVIDSPEFQRSSTKLSFGLGKDITGRVLVTDIAKMPHLLIAGATGSGKSVCINTLIVSLLYKAKPEEVRLLMIDPKVVELSIYNGIPHLLIPVVTDAKKAAGALNWAVQEMNDRYKLFAAAGVRDLKGYNQAVEEKGDTPKLPQIVIIVDELADLMMVASSEVEDAICRLAQMARAAGLHLIIATQRPSVDVITGLIKANVPSRIAFNVSSGTDSRTIIDMNGAEKLLGKGDMLFYPVGYPKPVRIQGAFISDHEVENIVEYLKTQQQTQYNQKVMNHLNRADDTAAGSDNKDDLDELFADALELVVDKERASASMLQRYFRIGFNRAARLLDQLTEAGYVGEEQGSKPREVLLTRREWQQLKDKADAADSQTRDAGLSEDNFHSASAETPKLSPLAGDGLAEQSSGPVLTEEMPLTATGMGAAEAGAAAEAAPAIPAAGERPEAEFASEYQEQEPEEVNDAINDIWEELRNRD